MSRKHSSSSQPDGQGGLQHTVIHTQDDQFIRECDLKWENDLRRTCWSSDVPREITDKIIQDHREKQKKKRKLRSGGTPKKEEPIDHYDRAVSVGTTIDLAQEAAIAQDRDGDQHIEAGNEDDSRSIRPPTRPVTPQIIKAPTIHQEVITHHRHIDHGFEVPLRFKRGPEGGGAAQDVDGNPGVDGDEPNVATEGSSSSRSSSTTRMPMPHVINAPPVHHEVVTNIRDLALGGSKADRMVDLLETILLTLREEVRVTPLIKSTGETDTKPGRSMEELQEAEDQAEQETGPQKALPPPAKPKKPRRGKKQARTLEHA